MKKGLLIIFAAALIVAVFAAEKLNVFKIDKSLSDFHVSAIDSITFSSDNGYMNVHKSDKSVFNYLVSEIDSISFSGSPDTVKISFSGASATVINPLEGNGILVTVSGADVVVNSSVTENEVRYLLSGNSTDGSVKFYSTFKSEIILNGLNLTNADGPAINNQSTKKTTITLAAGKTNVLADGTTLAASTEDQKGAFFSEGQLVFTGSGSLSVAGNYSHAICSDDYIEIESGSVTVISAKKDGIHAKDHFNLEGGTVNVSATGDAIECEAGRIKVEGGSLVATVASADAKGLKCDSMLSVSGGTVNLTVSGNQAKGFKSGGIMNLSGGTIIINTSGIAVLTASGSGFEPSYCTAIKCDTVVNLTGSNVTITSTGVGGKGISSDNNINITGGTINVTTSGNGATYTNSTAVVDAYASSGIEADGNINILAGNVTATTSGTGSKGISADGALTFGDTTSSPIVKVTNSGTKLLVSGTANYTTAVYAEPKAIKSDGNFTVNNGAFTITNSQQGSTGIDCDAIMNIKGGAFTLTVGGGKSKGLKSTGSMNLTGGTIGITASGAAVLENVAAATYDPSYCTAIKGTGIITINGSNITITHTGAGSKGISGDTDVNIVSGIVKVTTSGAGATYKNSSNVTDSYSASCITTDANLSISGGEVTCSSSGAGGKGLSVTGTIIIGTTTSSPTLNLTTSGSTFTVSGSDLCHPKTIVSTGAITIKNGLLTISSKDDGMHSEASITIAGGTTNITSSVEGIESKYVNITGGTNTITSSNDGINVTMGTTSGGTESDDNSLLTISGGTTYVTGADAIDSNGDLTMTGGIVFANGPSSGAEEYCDINGTANFNGGTFVGCGTAGMQKAPATTSTQPSLFMKGTLTAGTMYTVTIAGAGVVSFKPKNGGGACLVTTPQMTKGAAYTLYSGGSYSGGTSTNNLYLNGTFSSTGATSKKTGTLSTSSTVNSITF